MCLWVAVTFANGQAIKVTSYNTKPGKTASSGYATHELGSPATVITQEEFGGAYVYWKIDVLNYKAVKARYRLDFHVMQVKDGKEAISYKHDLFLPTKNGTFYMYSEFTEGSYVVYIRDQDNPDDVYSKTTFTVPPKPKVDYKNNSTLVVCKSVDDNWNPIGQTATVKAGDCMNFLYKAKDRVGYAVMIWNVVKINAQGNEEYVTHLRQGTQGKPFRWLATGEGVCAFQTPGKYRVYLFKSDDYDTSIQRGEDSDYIGKTEITVQ